MCFLDEHLFNYFKGNNSKAYVVQVDFFISICNASGDIYVLPNKCTYVSPLHLNVFRSIQNLPGIDLNELFFNSLGRKMLKQYHARVENVELLLHTLERCHLGVELKNR
jgi:hypothetical protein